MLQVLTVSPPSVSVDAEPWMQRTYCTWVPKAQLSGQKGESITLLHSVLLYQFKEGPVLPLSSVPLCQGMQHNDWQLQGPVYLAHPPTHHQRS